MIVNAWLPQAVMAATAVIWSNLYDSSNINVQLSVTLFVFILSTGTFVLGHLADITTYGVPTTILLLLRSPIFGDCSPFQGRGMVAVTPLFVCAVLFCSVELARGARALMRPVNNQAHPRHDAIDNPRTPLLTEDRDGMTDAESRTSGGSRSNPPRIGRSPERRLSDPGFTAIETTYTGQESPRRLARSRRRSLESLTLTTSMSARKSLVDFVGGFDEHFADETIPITPPTEWGPYYYGGWCSTTPAIYQDESLSSSNESQSDSDENPSDLDDSQPEVG
ncbi:hypothetical protein V492_03357 [Pseudogymnoascus sp. VKM F-4246]|nr:hypothetical protein V492_03357 [Pseudogymnoascus sp. VKM F-4246]